jgi:DNA-binding response OmpR family regulator
VDKPKILIVDDEQNILLYLSEALEDEGYDITTKLNGQEAIEAVQVDAYDLVLVDLKLRDMEGLEVMRAAKESDPDTTVIMLTGHGSLESAVEAIRHGAFDYLLKPVGVQDLKASLKRGLDKRDDSLQQKRLAKQARQFARAVLEGGDLPAPSENGVVRTDTKAADDERVNVGDVIVDIKKHEVRRGSDLLNLTPTEFNLLVTLMNNAGRVLSCKYLVKQVHNYDLSEFDSRSMIRVHIKHLRHKIERDPNNPEYILNVRGLGYKFGA